MITNKEVAVSVKYNAIVGFCNSKRWPDNTIRSKELNHHHFLYGGDGIRITRTTKRYEIVFIQHYYENVYHITSPYYIDYGIILNMVECDVVKRLRILSMCIFKNELPKFIHMSSLRLISNFNLLDCGSSNTQLHRLNVLLMMEYTIFHDFLKLNFRGYVWLCVATIHLKFLPKDIRKLIYNLI